MSEDEPDLKTLKLLNNTIADVTVEMEGMRPNTAIAKLIVLNNHLTSLDAVPRAAVEPLILMLAPIAPHICEELWNRLGHAASLAHESWPVADERYVGQDTITAVVQIKGKVRAKLEVSPDIDSGRARTDGAGGRGRSSGRQDAAQGDRQGAEDRLDCAGRIIDQGRKGGHPLLPHTPTMGGLPGMGGRPSPYMRA